LQFVGDGGAANGVAVIQNHPQPVHLRHHTGQGRAAWIAELIQGAWPWPRK
jgi:hypothetical protein